MVEGSVLATLTLGIKQCSGHQQLQVHLGIDIARDINPVHAEILALELSATSDGDVRAAQRQAIHIKAPSTAEGSL